MKKKVPAAYPVGLGMLEPKAPLCPLFQIGLRITATLPDHGQP